MNLHAQSIYIKNKTLQEITKEIPNLVTIVETNIYAAIIPNKKVLVTAASGKESLVKILNPINHEDLNQRKRTITSTKY